LPSTRALRGETVIMEHFTATGEAGNQFHLQASAAPLQSAGRTWGAVVVLHDITQHKRLEEALAVERDLLEGRVRERTAALRASAERLRAIFQEAPMGIAQADGDGRLIETNAAFQDMLGYSREELRGLTFADVTHPEDVESDLALFEELLAGEREGYHLQKRYIRKDGKVVWVNLSVSLVRGLGDEAGFYLGMVEDISEERRAQEALMRSEKLAVAGRLAASLAHEINNPLQSVIGCLGLAEEALAGGEAAGPYLRVADEELRRTARIVSRLRELYRPAADTVWQALDLNQLIPDLLTLNRPQLQARHVEASWWADETLPPLVGAPDQIRQVFLNLVLNALDAMAEGGRLEIVALPTERPVGVEVAVRDSGPGIPPEAMEHIFEPFYSSRENGLGLGLFVSHHIVRHHGGRIDVESQVGEGTTFRVWLPSQAE
jgi:PAS domain S-box-containing protein